jgi:type III secretion system YscJ/HrcJ family lipoprotein
MHRLLRIAGVLAVLDLGGCGLELEHGLDERQANEAVAALDRAGIGAEKVADEAQGAFKLVVARSDAPQAFRVLESHGLPRRAQKGVGEAFAEKGILPSATAERARLATALAADLESALGQIDGVTSARVFIALPEDDPLRTAAARPRPTASVLIHVRPDARSIESDARHTVANAVEGLQAADVNVVLSVDKEVPAPAELAQVGPLRVARASRSSAIAILTGALLAILALSVTLVIGAMRLGALRRKMRERS